MKKKIKSIIRKCKKLHFRYYLYIRDKHLIKLHNLPKLSRSEMKEVKQTWPCFNFRQSDLIYLRMYKKEYGFDPYFICDHHLGYILEKTNPYNQVAALQNKAMLDIYFNELPLPEVFVRCIANVFYDKTMKIFAIDEAMEFLKTKDEFIIKPSVETGSGKGVKKVNLNNISEEYLRELFLSYNGNFIAQEVLYQSDEIEKLNPTSLNTCRITTIFLNGKFDYSSIFKVGKKGADKDNWSCSYLVGMNKDGNFHRFGYDNQLNKVYKSDNDILFEGLHFPNFKAMVEFTKKYHINYFPNCGIVGWDILIDKNDNVRVIEVNLDWPGVVGEQLCSGTFFKSFRDEICLMLSK